MCVIRRGVQGVERSFRLLTWFITPWSQPQVAALVAWMIVVGRQEQIEFAGQALVASQAASGTKEERHGQAR